MTWKSTKAPSLADIEALALAARDALPDAFRLPAQAVAIRVVDFASDDMLDGLGIEDAFQLTGLYDGIPLTEKSTADQPQLPDAIWLFRESIIYLAAQENQSDSLLNQIRITLLHEIGHHFGLDEDDLDRLGFG